jgi:hypothetical protein
MFGSAIILVQQPLSVNEFLACEVDKLKSLLSPDNNDTAVITVLYFIVYPAVHTLSYSRRCRLQFSHSPAPSHHQPAVFKLFTAMSKSQVPCWNSDHLMCQTAFHQTTNRPRTSITPPACALRATSRHALPL